jgi:hypothetical protein
MHYAVKLALEDGIAALDAGTLRSGDIPSGVIVSLRGRKTALEAALAVPQRNVWGMYARVELADICRLLNALSVFSSPLEGEGA